MAITRPRDARAELSWSGWGDPDQASPLADGLRRLLHDALGVSPSRPAPGSIAELALSPARLGAPAQAELERIVGAEHARADHETRARHALGKSTLDLLTLRAGEPVPAPDLVLTPGTHEQVMEILRVCTERRIALVPFGGGTSVVGGLAPRANRFAGLVALDLSRMNAMLELDEESRLATFEPGIRGPEAEALLAERGYTIGHFPQSFEYATLGGFAAARSSGQASAGYGRFDELVLGLRVATPAGTVTLGRAPRSAAGPDLRQLILGSEGALGVITRLTVQIRPAPERRVYDGWRFTSFADGAATLRRLVQDGPVPTVLRLSDEAETALGLAAPRELGASPEPEPEPELEPEPEPGGSLAIVGYEGTGEEVARRRAGAEAVLARAGATQVPGAGEDWVRDRFRGPYLRDSLLDAGALVETLETVGFWSSLSGLYSAVSAALRDSLTAAGAPPVILCHISHVYPSGASLYFTVACAQGEDPRSRWRSAKAAAGDAILAAGGSITHHHGVGTDHRAWYERELGNLPVSVLQAAKATLDPAGILNPGILIGPAGSAESTSTG